MKYIKIILISFILIFVLCKNLGNFDTLGQKNNNPLNLKASYNWKGMVGQDKYKHSIFKSLNWGIRAGLLNLRNHFKNNPNETLVKYLNIFAEENGTNEVQYIAKKLNIPIYTKLKDLNYIDIFIPLAYFESKIIIDKQTVIKINKKLLDEF